MIQTRALIGSQKLPIEIGKSFICKICHRHYCYRKYIISSSCKFPVFLRILYWCFYECNLNCFRCDQLGINDWFWELAPASNLKYKRNRASEILSKWIELNSTNRFLWKKNLLVHLFWIHCDSRLQNGKPNGNKKENESN